MFKLSPAQERQHVDRRYDLSLNLSGAALEARIQEEVRELTYYEVEGFTKVDDPGHGYLIVPAKHPLRFYAVRCESECSRPYRTAAGDILLEEDCDAQKFLEHVRLHVQGQAARIQALGSVNAVKKALGHPEYGVQYRLIGKPEEPSVAHGDGWQASEVK